MPQRDIYSIIVENLDEGIFFIDKSKTVILWNSTAEEITGFKSGDVTGKLCYDNLLDPIGNDGGLLCLSGCPVEHVLINGEALETELFIRHKKGHRLPVMAKFMPAYLDGEVVGSIIRVSPIGKIKENDGLADSITSLASIDRITGLLNRRGLESALELKCDEYKRSGTCFAVVIMSIIKHEEHSMRGDIGKIGEKNNDKSDNAKDDQNDSEAISCVAAAISDTIRSRDIVGRWSQNEFLAIFAVDNASKLDLVVKKVRGAVEAPFQDKEIKSYSVRIGSTIVCGTDTRSSIVERAKYLSYAAR